MYFTTQFAGLLMALAASTISAQAAAVTARDSLAHLTVVFYDEVNFSGSVYAPTTIAPTVCQDLPAEWAGRPESVQISAGYSCTFFARSHCEGLGVTLTGSSSNLPANTNPPLYNNIDSFSCNRL
ncbi:hypothetical protein CVT25_013027 [Psilocybe cyanescens]|uniref:Beta/gamma crystallin 'Greek key' domain-containing protein n=1 Tax=Psilocybe cyanescens TaxID=93625 RepID=A0A409WCF1_PSICY|nr:hypothetical protein CVT25_013027 [Psilocybe cyanescens]